jgi:tetratricopeptide (TPR) repeat protein
MRAALELYRGRNYSGVVAVCTAALADAPQHIPLRLLLSKSLLALRRDVEAQQELSECLRREPRCSTAYRLLGELALRRDELKSAEIFFREALRIDPSDKDINDWLEITLSLYQPTAAVEKLPAATVAAGCPSPPTRDPIEAKQSGRRRFPKGTCSDSPHAAPPNSAIFGTYLVEIGALSRVQAKAALAYHQSACVPLERAATALGFISEPKMARARMEFRTWADGKSLQS